MFPFLAWRGATPSVLAALHLSEPCPLPHINSCPSSKTTPAAHARPSSSCLTKPALARGTVRDPQLMLTTVTGILPRHPWYEKYQDNPDFYHFGFSHPTTEPPVKSTTACTWFSSGYIIRVSPMQSDPACALPTPHPSHPAPTIPTRAALVCSPLGPTRPSLLPLQPACQSAPCMECPGACLPKHRPSQIGGLTAEHPSIT